MSDVDELEINPMPLEDNGLIDEFQAMASESYEYCKKELFITNEEVLHGLTPEGELNYFRGLLRRQRERGWE